jgi:hypothetical protein
MAAARAVMPSADGQDLVRAYPRLLDKNLIDGRLASAMPLRLVPPIHRATHRIGLYLAGLRDDALSQGEAHILALLATSGPSTIAELHRGLAHKRSTLTSILDRLAARGFVTRAVGSADRRTFVVTPNRDGTPGGHSRASSPHGSRACRRHARVESTTSRS